MGLEADQELILRQALASQLALIPECGFIIPAPLYCNGIAEFFATLDNSQDTKEEIELTPIAAAWLYPLTFLDDFTSGGLDSPLINFTYEIYLFRQYGLEREDETQPPEVFESMVLKQHNLFVKAWLDIKASFQGNRNIAGLDPSIFATARTTSLTQLGFIENLSRCQFVPGIVGFTVQLQETIQIKLVAC
jgi:hypothetical protein